MDQIVEWAKELQSLAQAGLYYGHDAYDKERYQRIREIAAEMMLMRSDVPAEKITGLFCGDEGYQTPKVDKMRDKACLIGSNWKSARYMSCICE